MIEIKKAERSQAKLRIGVSGPAGSGKSMSALYIAKGMLGSWDKICVIDTENGSGQLYSHLGDYSVITLEAPYTPERYIEAIQAAEKAGFEIIIIDSVSPEWDGKGGLLEANDLIGQTKFRGNSFMAWSVTTPRHQKFIEAIVTSKAHIITTVRTKTDMIQGEDKKVKKVGLKEIQREGFEYELTVNFNIDRDKHYAIASKDRTGLFSENDPFIITEATGQTIAAWNGKGKPVPTAAELAAAAAEKKRIEAEEARKKEIATMKVGIVRSLKFLGEDTATKETISAAVKKLTGDDLVDEKLAEIGAKLKILDAEKQEAEIKGAALDGDAMAAAGRSE